MQLTTTTTATTTPHESSRMKISFTLSSLRVPIALLLVTFQHLGGGGGVVEGYDILVKTTFRTADESQQCGGCYTGSTCVNKGTSYHLIDECYNTGSTSSNQYKILNSAQVCLSSYNLRNCFNSQGGCTASQYGSCQNGFFHEVLLNWCVESPVPTGDYTTPMVTQQKTTSNTCDEDSLQETLVPADPHLCLDQNERSTVTFCDGSIQKVAIFEGQSCTVGSLLADEGYELTETCSLVQQPSLYGTSNCGAINLYCRDFAMRSNLVGQTYLEEAITNNRAVTNAPTPGPSTAAPSTVGTGEDGTPADNAPSSSSRITVTGGVVWTTLLAPVVASLLVALFLKQ